MKNENKFMNIFCMGYGNDMTKGSSGYTTLSNI